MNKVKVYATRINTDDSLENYSFLLPFINERKRNLIQKYHNIKDKLRAFKGEYLVRQVIQDTLKIPYSEVRFEYMSAGKPYLPGYDSFHFNISHSGDMIVLAVHSKPVGIDVEEIQPINDLELSSYFSLCEIDKLLSQKPEAHEAYFYELWTMKESFIKAIGAGLTIEPNTFSLTFCDSLYCVSHDDLQTYYIDRYEVQTGYKMAVCSLSRSFDHRICFYDL
jgi:4'-phosphopantetheinyl transferase